MDVRRLELLRPDHAAVLLDFETVNRVWFTRSISDRGDAYFEHFHEGLDALVAEQDRGIGAYYLLVDDDDSVLGRFNLIFGPAGTATLGYRVAERVGGQGVATSSVRELLRIAASAHGIRTVRAATSHANVASQRVLLNTGFVAVGPAGPVDLGGRTGTWYERDLDDRAAGVDDAAIVGPVLTVARLEPDDRPAWEALFRAYIDFYERDEPQATYDRAWDEFARDESLHAFGAKVDGRLVGITHFLVHPSTSSADVCYLQDLFTVPDARGHGVGRALIEAVAGWARDRGCARLYWQTKVTNTVARRLYDSVTGDSEFMVYRLPL